ncbi:MAG: hypothetical protein ABSG65_09320 [Bryobacteraceae bacterium]|jgi:hypothetical protein
MLFGMRVLKLISCFGLTAILVFGQANTSGVVKTTVCEIAKHPEAFDGKVVQMGALVEAGVQDLPSGVTDDACGGELKFFMPDDAHFALLLKSKGYRKLVKDVKKNPVVEATVTGLFKHFGTVEKPDNRLALESVENVVVHPQPRVKGQKR